MLELYQIPAWLPAVFFLIAFLYASVGIGGGSSYTAMMAIVSFPAAVIPTVSLILNLVVTTVGSIQFIRSKHADFRLILPFILSSIPMAYLGGALRLPKEIFFWILWLSLVFVAARIYFWEHTEFRFAFSRSTRLIVSLISGAILGLIAGIVGIGGGVYLVPLIILLGLGSAKQAAACGAIFVWLNSIAGLIARMQFNAIALQEIIFLVLAVLAGGAIGSFLGAKRFSAKTMEKALGIIIIIAVILLGRRLMF